MFRRYSNLGVLVLMCAALAVIRAVPQRSQPVESESAESRVPVETAARLFPEAARTWAKTDSGWTQVFNHAGKVLGAIVSTEPFMDHIRGYAGPVPVLIGIDPDGTIVEVQLLEHRETPGFIRRIQHAGFLDHWRGLPSAQVATQSIDAVSGATLSSTAIAQSIQGRLAMLEPPPGGESSPLPADAGNGFRVGWLDVAILALLAVAVRVSWRTAPSRTARYGVQVAGLVLLGAIGATMFSMSLLEGWAHAGRPYGGGGTIALVLLAVAAPLATGRNLYCHSLCPFGTLQELLFKASPQRRHLPAGVARRLRPLRAVLLVAVVLSAIAGVGLQPDHQEPFSIFRWMSAGLPALGLAGVALLASAGGFYRPWCTFFCSSGALLDALRTSRKSRPPGPADGPRTDSPPPSPPAPPGSEASGF